MDREYIHVDEFLTREQIEQYNLRVKNNRDRIDFFYKFTVTYYRFAKMMQTEPPANYNATMDVYMPAVCSIPFEDDKLEYIWEECERCRDEHYAELWE